MSDEEAPHDLSSERRAAMAAEVAEGLSQARKELPPKLFYDAEGSRLFDAITALKAYYPTRTETAIMRQHGAAMAARIGPEALLVEFGSGSSEKTRILLDQLVQPAGYVPVDISAKHLESAAARLRLAYPQIEILPLAGDYSTLLEIPESSHPARRRVIYFAGSTIGNFHPPEARDFLALMAREAGSGGGVLIGVDMVKDHAVLERAYDDPEGVTAAFNLNMLRRLNRELGMDFELSAFRHRACYEAGLQRIEMHLVSQREQSVRLDGQRFHFEAGETILTECSYKHTPEGFRSLAESAGLKVVEVWTDEKGWFSVQYLEPASR